MPSLLARARARVHVPGRVRVQIHTMLDGRTCKACLHAAGEIRDVGQLFSVPPLGDFESPPFHIHCRCIPAPYQRGYKGEAQKIARQLLRERTKPGVGYGA